MALSEFQRAVLAMTREQVLATWMREQAANRANGRHYYGRLIDPATGAVSASLKDDSPCAS